MIQDLTDSALRTTMDHIIAHSTTKYRGAHMCLRNLSKLTKHRIRKNNVPLGLREYVSLTETDDLDADWLRLKQHPHSRLLTRDDVCTNYPRFLRIWEVEIHFPNTDVDDWMSMFVRLADDIPFLLDCNTDRLTAFASAKFKGLLYVMRLLVSLGFTDWKTMQYSLNFNSWNDHFFTLISETGYKVPYEVYSKAMTCHLCICALIEETGQFASLDIDDVYKSIGPDWTARLIIQHGDECDLTNGTIFKLFSRDQKFQDTDCIRETQLDILNIHGSQLLQEDLPTIRFLTLWALDRLPIESCDLTYSLCETDIDFLRRHTVLPSFFV